MHRLSALNYWRNVDNSATRYYRHPSDHTTSTVHCQSSVTTISINGDCNVGNLVIKGGINFIDEWTRFLLYLLWEELRWRKLPTLFAECRTICWVEVFFTCQLVPINTAPTVCTYYCKGISATTCQYYDAIILGIRTLVEFEKLSILFHKFFNQNTQKAAFLRIISKIYIIPSRMICCVLVNIFDDYYHQFRLIIQNCS